MLARLCQNSLLEKVCSLLSVKRVVLKAKQTRDIAGGRRFLARTFALAAAQDDHHDSAPRAFPRRDSARRHADGRNEKGVSVLLSNAWVVAELSLAPCFPLLTVLPSCPPALLPSLSLSLSPSAARFPPALLNTGAWCRHVYITTGDVVKNVTDLLDSKTAVPLFKDQEEKLAAGLTVCAFSCARAPRARVCAGV